MKLTRTERLIEIATVIALMIPAIALIGVTQYAVYLAYN